MAMKKLINLKDEIRLLVQVTLLSSPSFGWRWKMVTAKRSAREKPVRALVQARDGVITELFSRGET